MYFSFGNFHTLIWGGPFAGLNYAYVIAILTCLSWAVFSNEKKQLPITPLVVLDVAVFGMDYVYLGVSHWRPVRASGTNGPPSKKFCSCASSAMR